MLKEFEEIEDLGYVVEIVDEVLETTEDHWLMVLKHCTSEVSYE